MGKHSEPDPATVIARLQQAINRHDLDALATCFAPDYLSECPHTRPGIPGARARYKNWRQIFGDVSDLAATLVGCTVAGETAWAEWDWWGTHREEVVSALRGVTIQGLSRGGSFGRGCTSNRSRRPAPSRTRRCGAMSPGPSRGSVLRNSG